MPVPNTFANATTSIPLSQLDANFATPITLGNTAIQLGNTVTTLNNMTLANVTVNSGNLTTSTVTVGAGSNTAPSITFSGDTNTGIYSPAADTIAFTEGGVEAMRIDSSANVGIGTTSPTARLDVNGTVRAGTASGVSLSIASNSAIRDTTNGASTMYFDVATGGASHGAFDFRSSNAFTSRMYIDTSGNVGIGTASPGGRLDVFNSSGAAVSLVRAAAGQNAFFSVIGNGNAFLSTSFDMFQDTNNTAALTQRANGPLYFSTNNLERMRIDASGNVGIGTSSPGNKLDIVNAGTSQIRVKDGVGATAYYDFGRDGTDGLFGFSGAQTTFSGYKWSVNAGTEVMRITNAGNVGIGTNSPNGRFNVAGGRSFFSPNGEVYAIATTFNLTRANSGQAYYIGATDSATPDMVFSNVFGSEAVRFTNAGNVGIGTSNALAKLTVFTGSLNSLDGVLVRGGPGANNVSLRPSMGAGSNNNIVQTGDSGIIFDGGAVDTGAFVIAPWASATSGIRIVASTGNVGIGTSSPSATLDVRNPSGNCLISAQFGTGTKGEFIAAANQVDIKAYNGTNDVLTFTTGASERARIASNGDFLVGKTTSAVDSANGVTLTNGACNHSFQITNNEAWIWNNRTTGVSYNLSFRTNNSVRGSITVTDSGTTYGTVSDYRLKENVVPLTGAAARVQALKPSRFNFIADPAHTVDGFIAHEAAQVVPEAVTGEKDAVNEDGSIKPQGIDHSKLVPLLTAALQEALTDIASLKARVAALENK